MTARLPVVGGDSGQWGTILNTFLSVSINSNGTLIGTAVSAAGAEMTANKGAASGYAPLNSSTVVPTANLGTGTASTTTFLRGDNSWQTAATFTIDSTATDIQALGTQAAGGTGKAADAGHVHPTTGIALLTGASFTGNVSTTGTLSGAGISSTDAVTSGVVALTYGTTISVNAAAGNHFRVVLTGNATLSNPTNPVDGQKITFELIQDSSGSRTIAFGSAYAFSTDIPQPTLTTTLNKRDFLGFVYNATTSLWYMLAVVHGF
jgi:hypothetical protein